MLKLDLRYFDTQGLENVLEILGLLEVPGVIHSVAPTMRGVQTSTAPWVMETAVKAEEAEAEERGEAEAEAEGVLWKGEGMKGEEGAEAGTGIGIVIGITQPQAKKGKEGMDFTQGDTVRSGNGESPLSLLTITTGDSGKTEGAAVGSRIRGDSLKLAGVGEATEATEATASEAELGTQQEWGSGAEACSGAASSVPVSLEGEGQPKPQTTVREAWIQYSVYDSVLTWKLWFALKRQLEIIDWWKPGETSPSGNMYDLYRVR